MDYYDIWCDLAPGAKDLELCHALDEYLGKLQASGNIDGYTVARRKFGFGPAGLGEFHIRIAVRDLVQLEQAFYQVAPREEPLESLHAAVFSRVTNYKSGLYRDFPDPVRKAIAPEGK